MPSCLRGMLQQVKRSCTSSSFRSRSVLWDTAQTGAGKRENMLLHIPVDADGCTGTPGLVLRSLGCSSNKCSGSITTAAFPWLQRLNATFVYWPISQEKFLLKENQQVRVSVLAQIPLLHKPRAGAMLAFATTWHKTQTTVELLASLHTMVVSEPQGGAEPA